MKSTIYNTKGKEAGSVDLPESIFSTQWNADLVHQVVVSMMSNARTPVAHTKTRADVRGGGRKPWQQKGLGRARHGSSRSPIWVGGGVTHGPRNDKNFARKINRKMKAAALYSLLAKKFKDGEILFVDSFDFKGPKTAEALTVMKALGGIKGFERMTTKKVNTAFIALPTKSVAAEKSFQNFGNVEVGETRNLNPLHVVNYKYLVIADPEKALKTLEKSEK